MYCPAGTHVLTKPYWFFGFCIPGVSCTMSWMGQGVFVRVRFALASKSIAKFGRDFSDDHLRPTSTCRIYSRPMSLLSIFQYIYCWFIFFSIFPYATIKEYIGFLVVLVTGVPGASQIGVRTMSPIISRDSRHWRPVRLSEHGHFLINSVGSDHICVTRTVPVTDGQSNHM